ncbi:UDP-N-acetylmuramoyl-tripeptide--D-alanyl-D-alanine ligase [Kosmotoga pacifica]|nr:UDP-N-acetylmuramoyl-tripeptide--D-alanyl-D-alanine ligase [Kosmotoga pacifica]
MDQKTIAEFLRLTEGRRLKLDSRKIETGDVFIALKGTRYDGNDFVEDALNRGASLVVTSRNLSGDRVFTVAEPLQLLFCSARMVIRNSKMRHKIGITGSNGKTTTKELLHSTLSKIAPTFKTPGNLNTEIGIPISILENRDALLEAEYGAFELAADKKGDIRKLVELVEPDISILTNVGTAHLGKYNSPQELLEEKLSIFSALNNEGVAITNGDDLRIVKELKNASFRLLLFGEKNGQLVLANYRYIGNNTFVTLNFNNEERLLRLKNFWNKGQILDLMAVYLTLYSIGVDVPELLLVDSQLSFKDRFHVYDLAGIRVINDCYNSSIESVMVAIDALKRLRTGKKYAVVGSILEQGLFAKKTHLKLAELLKEFDAVVLYTRDRQIGYVTEALEVSFATDSIESIADWLLKHVEEGDLVYFKASRGVGLENVLKAFKEKIAKDG